MLRLTLLEAALHLFSSFSGTCTPTLIKGVTFSFRMLGDGVVSSFAVGVG
jgi:hypothetical protein